jgi:hypothetical protein
MKELVLGTPTSGLIHMFNLCHQFEWDWDFVINEILTFKNTHIRTTIAQYDNMLFKYAVIYEYLQ